MPFLSDKETEELGFKYLGRGVKISSLASFYFPEEIEIGNNSRIDDFCVLSGKIKIGSNVHIAVHCSISGGGEGVFFDDFSGLSYGCHVFAKSDDYSGNSLTNPTVQDKFKRLVQGHIYLGKHVIVGAGSTIFPGVEISEGCAIGSMSMVTKSTKPWHIYFGIPAKSIKKRNKKILDLEKKFNKEKGT